jgi:hypothetical protein
LNGGNIRRIPILKAVLLWILAGVITLASVVYQRVTGPTYPLSGKTEIADTEIKYKLLRTHVTDADSRMDIDIAGTNIKGKIKWRRFKSHDPWTTEDLIREDDKLIVTIPRQPPAGKVIYEVTLFDSEGKKYELSSEPVLIRFKGSVPIYIVIPHVLLIFMALLFSTRAGFEAVLKGRQSYKLALWTLVIMFIGGLIFGPIMQKFAFGAYWTGWPVGHDLTDTKTAVAALFWIIAIWRANKMGRGRGWIILAAIVTFIIFLIPHSVLGSELDYTRME